MFLRGAKARQCRHDFLHLLSCRVTVPAGFVSVNDRCWRRSTSSSNEAPSTSLKIFRTSSGITISRPAMMRLRILRGSSQNRADNRSCLFFGNVDPQAQGLRKKVATDTTDRSRRSVLVVYVANRILSKKKLAQEQSSSER